MSTASYVRVVFHPAAWERIRPLIEAQDLDPQPAGREYTVTPTAEQLRAWRRTAQLRAIPEGDLVVERINHHGALPYDGPAGVRLRHVPTRIVVEARNHRKLLRNKVDALEILADRLIELEESRGE